MNFDVLIFFLHVSGIYTLKKSKDLISNNLTDLTNEKYIRNLNTEGFGPAGDGYHI